MQDTIDRFSRGLTQAYTEIVRRTYYKAAFVPSQVQADSFTEPFKSAALSLAQDTANFGINPQAVRGFIFDWGNFVLDTATLGATLTRTMHTEPTASKYIVQKAKNGQQFGDMLSLLRGQGVTSPTFEVLNENSVAVRFETSKTFRSGELVGFAPDLDTCAIGGSVLPQVGRMRCA